MLMNDGFIPAFSSMVRFSWGLNFKLDVGLYQLDQQVASQRYRENPIIATRDSLIAEVKALFAPKTEAFAFA
jgi:hypothetical protein